MAKYHDQMPGGLADKKKPSDFDQEALNKGIQVEFEHTDNLMQATEIAMDHLTEDPFYYEKLATIEKEHLYSEGNNKMMKLSDIFLEAKKKSKKKSKSDSTKNKAKVVGGKKSKEEPFPEPVDIDDLSKDPTPKDVNWGSKPNEYGDFSYPSKYPSSPKFQSPKSGREPGTPKPKSTFPKPKDPDSLKYLGKDKEPDQEEPMPEPVDSPTNKDMPSLSALAQKATDDNDSALWSKFGQGPDDKIDPALKGLPKFDQEPEEHPFGEPPLPDTRTNVQKGADALKQGAGMAGQGLKKVGQTAFQKAMGAVGKTGNLVKQKAGQIFNKPSEPPVPFATAPQEKDKAGMPTLKRIAQQSGGNKQPFLAAGKDPKWKVGQTVDWRGQKGFKVVKADQNRYTLQKIEDGEIKTYKFIPGGTGLVPTATPEDSEKNFPGFIKQ